MSLSEDETGVKLIIIIIIIKMGKPKSSGWMKSTNGSLQPSDNIQLHYTLEPHYNAHFRVHSDMSVIKEQSYNKGLIHRKYKQWEPCL